MPTATPGPSAKHPTRMGAAPSSLRVQLPAGAFIDSFSTSSNTNNNRTSTRSVSQSQSQSQSRRPVNYTHNNDDGNASAGPSSQRASSNTGPPIQTSDATLLVQGIQQRQEKAKEIMVIQNILIEDRDISHEELKRCLTKLAVPHWLQINQERSLYQLCGYPLCRKRLPSERSRTAGRFTISVSRRAIEPDTSNDPGGKNNFCSIRCYSRSEWVKRWVLEPSVDTSQSSNNTLPLDQAVRGGMWEALTHRSEDQWDEIELLEDLEEKGQLDQWEGYGHVEEEPEQTTTKSTVIHPLPSSSATTEPPSSLLSSLTISERPKGAPPPLPSVSTTHRSPSFRTREKEDRDDTFADLLPSSTTRQLKRTIQQDDEEEEEKEEGEEETEDPEVTKLFDQAFALRDVLRMNKEFVE
ncbi:unnamed protein product [Sympodiomycopsis kandeliae]